MTNKGDTDIYFLLDQLGQTRERLERCERAYITMSHEIDQILGKALGYQWYKDDQKNFPGATEGDGVCTGEHVPETLAMEAASVILDLREALMRITGMDH